MIAEDNEEVRLEIMAEIQKVNRKAVSNAQKVEIDHGYYIGYLSSYTTLPKFSGP